MQSGGVSCVPSSHVDYVYVSCMYTNKEYFLYFTFPFLIQVYNDSTSYIWIRSLALVYNPSTAA
jgi:hypothetical protein